MIKPRPIYCPNVILLHADDNHIFPLDEAKQIIKKIAKGQKLITVFIHNEINDSLESQIVVKNYDYSIYKETRKKSGNVASELLKSGSDFVYYIKAEEENYRAAFIHIYDILSKDYPIVCIAGNLADQLKAGAIVIENSSQSYSELLELVYYPEKLFYTNSLQNVKLSFINNKIEPSNLG